MKISGTYHLDDVSPERAYALLQDPEVLAQAMPGCEEMVETGTGEYQMKMKLLIASLSGQFQGKVKLTEPNPPQSFRMQVDGNGKIGFLKGEGAIQLTPDTSGTLLTYDGDVQLGGTLAAVGQRLVDTTSKMMLKRFFSKLSEVAKG